jgi:hypothetical protein
MRRLLIATLFILVCVIAPPRVFGAPSLDLPAIPQPARLYLLAEGANPAAAQRVLAAMCRLFQQDAAYGRTSPFTSVTLIRDPADGTLEAVTARKLKSGANETQVDDFLHLMDGLRRTERSCLPDPQASAPAPSNSLPNVSVALLSVKIDKEQVPARASVTLAVVDTQTTQKILVSDPTDEQLDINEKGLEQSGRKLATKYLDLPREQTVQSTWVTSIAAEDRCTWGQQDSSCVRLGGGIEMRVEAADPIWVAPDDLNAIVSIACTGRTGSSTSKLPLSLAAKSADSNSRKTTLIGKVSETPRRAGTCTYKVLSTHPRIRFSSKNLSFRVEASPIFFDLLSGFAPATITLESTRFERNWIPFLAESMNASKLDARLRLLYLVPGDDLIQEGAVARSEIQALELPDVSNEVNAAMRQEIAETTDREGDLFAYGYLNRQQTAMRRTGPYPIRANYCLTLSKALQATIDRENVHASFDSWKTRCFRALGRSIVRIIEKARPPRWFGFRRGEAHTVYRAIQPMQKQPEALVPADGPLFAPQVGPVNRDRETYLVQPVISGRRQGTPVLLTVITERRMPDLELLMRRESFFWRHGPDDKPINEVTFASGPIARVNFFEGAAALEAGLRYRYALKTTLDAMNFRVGVAINPVRLIGMTSNYPPRILHRNSSFNWEFSSGFDSYQNSLFLQWGMDFGRQDLFFGFSTGGFVRGMWHASGPDKNSLEAGLRFTLRWMLYPSPLAIMDTSNHAQPAYPRGPSRAVRDPQQP